MTSSGYWQPKVGIQRDWVWRGWQTRYTYVRSAQPALPAKATVLEDSPISHAQPALLGMPVILLHGFGASLGHWRQNLGTLAQHHTVYALDLLGFGASQKASVNYDVSLWVEQVYDFWRTFIGTPTVLVGNSIGSLICLATAAAHPEMVAGIVMISLPDPAARTEAVPLWLQPIVEVAENLVASPPILRALFYLARRPGFVRRWVGVAYANPEAITDELVEILATPAQDWGAARAFCALLKAVGSAKFGPGVKTVLPTLKMPMLLIWGQLDRMIPPRFARPQQFLEYNPNLELVELEQAGHCPHDECPERVNQEILAWIEHRLLQTKSLPLEAGACENSEGQP